MAKPRVFVSSTYLDLIDVREVVGNCLTEFGFEATLFERGGVFFDPNLPVDQSCIAEVRKAQLFVLIIGGRYGSPSTVSPKKRRTGNYNSVTAEEFAAARDSNIPVLTFVKAQVVDELKTYNGIPKDERDKFKYAHVDNVQVFGLVEKIYRLKKGNPVFRYETASDIVRQLKQQLAGMWAQYLDELGHKRENPEKCRINAYKLFFYRRQRGMSFSQLSTETGIDRDRLRNFERVAKKYTSFDARVFPWCSVEELRKLESFFDCEGILRAGARDDYLSAYIQFYATYKGTRANTTREENDDESLYPTRAVVFDFDGTLTARDQDLTTWERLWVELGYNVNECAALHRQFSDNQITHEQWCSITRDKFRARNLNRDQLLKIAESIDILPGTARVLDNLHTNGVKLFLVSGSIGEIIRHSLGNLADYFSDLKANEMKFDSNGRLIDIFGTRYDFTGKADYLKKLIKREDVSPLEVLFVGNSCNDIWASQSGARTLCVNPRFTDPNIMEHWTYCLRKVEDLGDILRFAQPPKGS